MAEIKNMIVSLTGANYPTWKVQCKMSLLKDGLGEIVNGSETEPAKGYSKFITQRDRALAIIVLSIDTSISTWLEIPLTPP